MKRAPARRLITDITLAMSIRQQTSLALSAASVKVDSYHQLQTTSSIKMEFLT